MKYSEIINISKDWPIHYEWANFHVKCLKTQFSEHPWSIAECEAEFIYNKIINRNCKYGLEIGTGTGISSIFAGLAFNETSGRLITLDPFIEEHFGRCDLYTKESREQSLNGVGLHINSIYKELDIPVRSIVGWSPQDIRGIMQDENLPAFGQRLDYVFIDARHQSDSTLDDFNGVLPYLDDHCIIFFHDTPCIDQGTQDYISKEFKAEWAKPVEFHNPHGFNLSYLER